MKRPGSKKHSTKKTLGLVLVVGILAASTYAFTAGNSVPANNAGDGAAPVSGFVVTNLDYNEDGDADPSTIETVDFALDKDADRVQVQLNDGLDANTTGPTTWFDCATNSAVDVLDPLTNAVLGTGWQCDVEGYDAKAVSNFRVVAYEDNNAP